MAFPLVFAGIAAWGAEKFGTFAAKKAYNFAAAGVFVAGMVASVAGLVALVTVIPSPPQAISDALGYVAPADWGAQLALIVAARAYSLVWFTWREGYKIAVR